MTWMGGCLLAAGVTVGLVGNTWFSTVQAYGDASEADSSADCGTAPCPTDAPVSDAAQHLRERIVRPEDAASFDGDRDALAARGARLFADNDLSSNGLACISCHAGMNLYNDSFTEAYPHRVTMPFETAGLDTVDAETMVQFCLVMPMGTDPLPWQSQELAALSAYIEKIQPEYAAAVP
ncbi:MAG: hypothetical protein AAGA11_18960 [Pseudomonadota bacterium]